MIIAEREEIARERHVGIREAEQRRTLTEITLDRFAVAGLCFFAGFRRLLGRQTGGIVDVEKAARLRECRHQAQPLGLFARVAETGGQCGARIVRKLREQRGHPLDLGFLFVRHIAGELVQHRIIGRSGLIEQILDHGQRAVMMRDHQFQELLVERGTFKRSQLGHLLRRCHPGHHRMALNGAHIVSHRGMRGGIGHGLSAIAQPVLHEADLVRLRGVDALGDIEHLRVVGPVLDQRRHLHCLIVMLDHALHEGDVGGRETRVGDLYRLLGTQLAALLAGRAGLYDRHLLRTGGTGGQQHGQRKGQRQHAHLATVFTGHRTLHLSSSPIG